MQCSYSVTDFKYGFLRKMTDLPKHTHLYIVFFISYICMYSDKKSLIWHLLFAFLNYVEHLFLESIQLQFN